MVGPTFKTMYLVSKSDLYDDDKRKKNFKLSLQNRDICDGGMNVSVRPIKTRVKNKPLAKYITNSDDAESEDKNDNKVLSNKKYTYDRPIPQSIELNTVRKKQNPNYALQSEKNDFYRHSNDDDSGSKSEAISSTYYDKPTPLSIVETGGKELSENESLPLDINEYNNHDNGNIAQKQEDIATKSMEVVPKRYQSYKVKRLQKSYSKKMKKKFPDNQQSKNISYHEDLSPNHKDNETSEVNSDEKDNETSQVNSEEYIQDIDEGYKRNDVDDDPKDPKVPNLKKRKIMDDIQKFKEDQWLGRIKSRLSDKRVQFKRKHDTIGYRINPDDISKSLIKPSDISYLDETESADYLDKWKSLKELRKQPFKNKRFKLYR